MNEIAPEGTRNSRASQLWNSGKDLTVTEVGLIVTKSIASRRTTMQGHSEEQNPSGRTLATEDLTSQTNDSERVEFIDSIELARRWNVPVSWVRDQVRSRAQDPLPHINFGKY